MTICIFTDPPNVYEVFWCPPPPPFLACEPLDQRPVHRLPLFNNSPIQDYVHPDDQTQPTFEMTPGFKPFTVFFVKHHQKKDTSIKVGHFDFKHLQDGLLTFGKSRTQEVFC